MTKTASNHERNERIVYAAVWAVIAVLPIILELWKHVNDTSFQWRFVVRWWIGMIPLIVIFLIHNHILIPKFMKKGKMKTYCLILASLMTAYCAIQYATLPPRPDFQHREAPHMRPPMPDHTVTVPPMPMRMPPRPFPFPILFKLMLAVMTVGTNVAISLSFTYQREQEKRKELENSRLQEELKYLKQQISPHFLMNVLNNIHEMAEENIKGAQEMILELSYLLRYVLYDSEKEMTTLASESRFISSYVALMKMRYVEGIVKVSLDVPGHNTADTSIPPLLFISFIENAFKHGVSYNNETNINIRLCESDGKVIFTCDNTKPLEKTDNAQGGVGLSNVRRRLDLLYGEEYTLQIEQTETTHSVSLIIPCR